MWVVADGGLRGPSRNVREAFNVLDRDGDGRISFSDLQHFFNQHPYHLNLTKEEVESMISVADRNQDGCVEFEEFEGLMTSLMMMEEKNGVDVLEEAFRAMDRDGDGVVSVGDLKSFMGVAMQNVSDGDVVGMIEAAGVPAHPGICYKDFLALMAVMINGSQ